LGNIIESVLGFREEFLTTGCSSRDLSMRENQAVIALAESLGEFVNVTYQFILHTDSREDDVKPWLDFVRRLQGPDVDFGSMD